jgi:hypothetical protein
MEPEIEMSLPPRYELPKQQPQPERHHAAPPHDVGAGDALSRLLLEGAASVSTAVAMMQRLRHASRHPGSDASFRYLHDVLGTHKLRLLAIGAKAVMTGDLMAHIEAKIQLATVCEALHVPFPAEFADFPGDACAET